MKRILELRENNMTKKSIMHCMRGGNAFAPRDNIQKKYTNGRHFMLSPVSIKKKTNGIDAMVGFTYTYSHAMKFGPLGI